MSHLPVDSSGNTNFKWGVKGEIGIVYEEVQYYESFTYKGIEYMLHDCVYAYNGDEINIGKLLEIWEEENGSKGVRLHWFFLPRDFAKFGCENLLENQVILKNEIFLASGDGTGVADDITLEAIRGKCNVLCVSKDVKNPQPSKEDIQMADFIFYRTFDIKKLTIAEISDDKVGGFEAKFVFNRKQGEKIEDLKSSMVICKKLPASDYNIVSKTSDLERKMPRKLKIGDHVNKAKNTDLESFSNQGLPVKRKVRKLIFDKNKDDATCLPNLKEKIEYKASFMGKKEDAMKTKQSEDKLLKINHEGSVEKGKKFENNNIAVTRKTDDGFSKKAKIRNPESDEFEDEAATLISSKEKIKSKNDYIQKIDEKKRKQPDYKPCHEGSIKKGRKIEGENIKVPQKPDDGIFKKKRIRNPEGDELGDAADTLMSSKEKIKLKNDFIQKIDERKIKQSDNKLLMACYESSAKKGRKIEDVNIEVTRKPEDEKRNWFKVPWDERMKKAYEKSKLVLLSNLDPQCSSAEVEDIVWHAFKEMCTAKMVSRTAISSPNFGQAFIILTKQETAERIIKCLKDGCLMLNNGRPLFASFPPPPNSFRKQSEFSGHLSIDKVKQQSSKKKNEAVSTSHCSQPNTIEFEMAIEWLVLQERSNSWWKWLYKLLIFPNFSNKEKSWGNSRLVCKRSDSLMIHQIFDTNITSSGNWSALYKGYSKLQHITRMNIL